MEIKENEEIKKEFQLERVVLFSDAVFAIIITIMVIEIKLPEGLRHASHERIREALFELIPKFIGYVTAFFFVAVFWAKHLKLFSYLKDYTNKLITYNLIFLFFVSLFPFGVSVMTETLNPRNLDGLFVYFGVILMSMFTQTLLTGYLVRNAGQLCINADDIDRNLEWKAQRINFITIPLLFIYIVISEIYKLDVKYFSYIFIAWGVTLFIIRKRLYPKNPDNGPLLARLFKARKQSL